MNTRQLTRTGLVLLGAYLVAGSLASVAGLVATHALSPEPGFDWAIPWSVGAFVVPMVCVPGLVLIAASGWLSRRVASADDEASSTTSPPELLGVGLTLLGAVLVALALVHMLASSPLLWEDGRVRSLAVPVLITNAVEGALGIALVVVGRSAARFARGINDGGETVVNYRQLVRVGLILVGTVIVVLGLIDLVNWVVIRPDRPDTELGVFRELSSHARVEHRIRLVEGLTQCVLGGLVLLGSRDVARFVYR